MKSAISVSNSARVDSQPAIWTHAAVLAMLAGGLHSHQFSDRRFRLVADRLLGADGVGADETTGYDDLRVLARHHTSVARHRRLRCPVPGRSAPMGRSVRRRWPAGKSGAAPPPRRALQKCGRNMGNRRREGTAPRPAGGVRSYAGPPEQLLVSMECLSMEPPIRVLKNGAD